MRIIAETLNAAGKITVFDMNNKFIIKIEKGNYEQTYKISGLDYMIKDFADIEKLFDDEFTKTVNERFSAMDNDLANSLNRNDF